MKQLHISFNCNYFIKKCLPVIIVIALISNLLVQQQSLFAQSQEVIGSGVKGEVISSYTEFLNEQRILVERVVSGHAQLSAKRGLDVLNGNSDPFVQDYSEFYSKVVAPALNKAVSHPIYSSSISTCPGSGATLQNPKLVVSFQKYSNPQVDQAMIEVTLQSAISLYWQENGICTGKAAHAYASWLTW